MFSDVTGASERAGFRAPEPVRGITEMGYAGYLPHQVGLAMARDMLLTGRELDAAEARDCGPVSRVTHHVELLDRVREAGEDILRTGPDSRLQAKRALNTQYGLEDFMSFWASVRGRVRARA